MDQAAYLEDDWWKKSYTCQILGDLFYRHTLGLFISFSIENKRQDYTFSGAKLFYNDLLFWITAGHVIEILEKIRFHKPKINAMFWLDGCDIPGAEIIPVTNQEFSVFSTFDEGDGIDFGVGALTGHDAFAILSNSEARYLTERAWKNVDRSNPEGFYVVGYPKEWGVYSTQRLSNKQTKHSYYSQLACLPVQRIDSRRNNSLDDFWNDPDAFYGEILPFADGQVGQPEDIDGMSGGPIFSIELDEKGHLLYWPFGIQRSWNKDKRIIRAEPIQRIVRVITSESK